MRLIFMLSILLFSMNTFAKARWVTCPQKYPAIIKVPYDDVMSLRFPEKPKHSIPGNNQFNLIYVKNDLLAKGLVQNGTFNLFVYLPKKTCAFKLRTVPKHRADDIVNVRYPKEKNIEAKYVE